MNITDIDDKIILGSREANKNFEGYAKFWENDFFDDMKKLNVEYPDIMTRVSEFVPEIIAYIGKIMQNGFAYECNGSIYFDTAAFDAHQDHVYLKLKPQNAKKLEKL